MEANPAEPLEDPYTGFEVECAESFEFFVQMLTPNGIVPVVEPPVEFYESGLAWIKNHYYEIPKKDLMECMKQLLSDFRENMDTIPLRFEMMDELMRNFRVNMYDDILSEVMDYFNKFMWACHKTPPGENYLKARRHYFNVYGNRHFRELCDPDFYAIRSPAIILLGSNTDVEPELVKICLEIIFENMTENMNAYIDEGYINRWTRFGFIPHTLEFVNLLDPKELNPIHWDNILDLISMTKIIYTTDDDSLRGTLPFMDKGTIRGLFRLLDKFRYNRRLRLHILETILRVLESVHKQVETIKVSLKEEPFSILMDQIFHKNCLDPEDSYLPKETQLENREKSNAEAKEVAIKILITIYSILENKEEEDKSEFMEDIKSATRGYWRFYNNCGYFDKISWLLTHCRKIQTERILEWFHDHFSELERERQERGVHEDAVDEIYDFPVRRVVEEEEDQNVVEDEELVVPEEGREHG